MPLPTVVPPTAFIGSAQHTVCVGVSQIASTTGNLALGGCDCIDGPHILITLLIYHADPSFPEPVTGAPSCISPIRQLICTVDRKTGFVAGMEYGAGPDFGTRAVCSRGTRGKNVFRDTARGERHHNTVSKTV